MSEPARPIAKVLIANRGEIACRIARTARALGYRTVAVYSEADAGAPHRFAADEAAAIGPAAAQDSYLNIDRIIDAARASGADALHPGYGFLSENPALGEACIAAGLTFIGPSVEAIRAMGDKAEARRLMAKAGVPTVPGFEPEDPGDGDRLARAAEEIGFPVMVKALAGGGGRGMRLAENADALAEAVDSARQEARKAFGDDRILLEKAVRDPRHVEIQVIADAHGTVLHLGERDCSVQRRHQKVIEEAPCPTVDGALRTRMGEAAVEAARSIGYRGAGTVEFLLDADGAFYFIEMNTRLQVEHPVTEMVTGIDLVALQIAVADGQPLAMTQGDVRLSGHAIEARLYAEDPDSGFLPQSGTITGWVPPIGAGIRVDGGIVEGQAITPHYDPMLAKLIAHGPDRETARRRLVRALEDTALLGFANNRGFLARILEEPAFVAGTATTGLIGGMDQAGGVVVAEDWHIALAALLLSDVAPGEPVVRRADIDRRPWPMNLAIGTGREAIVTVMPEDGGAYRVRIDGDDSGHARLEGGGQHVRLIWNRVERQTVAHRAGPMVWINAPRGVLTVTDVTYPRPAEEADEADGTVRAPMNGTLSALDVAVGDAVSAGQRLGAMEAMKMDLPLKAAIDGRIAALHASVGDQVAARSAIIEITPDSEQSTGGDENG